MKLPNLTSIQKVFDSNFFELSREAIDSYSETDMQIYSVLSGLNKESFSIAIADEIVGNFAYCIIYIKNDSNDIKGYLLKLKPLLKYRNETVIFFCNYISNYFKGDADESKRLFNAFQYMQVMFFESKGYYTYGDEVAEISINKSASMVCKGNKLPLYIPYVIDNKEKITNKKNNLKNSSTNNKTEDNFVYIMLNKSNGYYKIGRSKNPEHREKTLQAEAPDIVLINKWIASAEIEKKLHFKYKLKRKRGEWFSLEEKDIEDIHAYMLQIVNIKKSKN